LLLAAGWLVTRLLQRMRSRGSLRTLQPKPLLWHAELSRYWVVVTATVLVFLASLYVASNVLERVPHVQDSITYLFQAQTIAGGELWAPAPPSAMSFEQEFLLVQDGRWFGKYAPGFPLVLALGVLLNASWLVNPILATLTVPLLYKLGTALYGHSTGNAAVLLAIASPFFLFMSGSMMVHPAELLWTTLFMLGWIRSLKGSSGKRWVLLAGIALGMVLLTRKITVMALGIPFVTIIAVAHLRIHGSTVRRWVMMKIGLLLAILSPFLLLLLAYQWALTGDPLQDPRLLYWEFDRPGFGQDVGMGFNILRLEKGEEEATVSWFFDPDQPPNGHSPARGLFNTEQNWRSLERHLFGWPAIFTVAFCGLAFLARRPNWADVALLVTVAASVVFYVFYWASGIMYGPRYYYAALPALLLLTARGIQAAGARIGGPAGKRVAIGLVMVLVAGNAFFYMPNVLEAYRDYNYVSGAESALVAEAVQGNTVVFVTVGYDWWDYGRFFSHNTPRLDGRVIYARDLGEERNHRLMALYPQYQAYLWRDRELFSLSSE
jgi:4-amino-4-deoxy-L-arabinose transferase-like glycosyltransferase